MQLRPSALPALVLSPLFVRAPAGENAMSGTDRHAALEAALRDDESLCDMLPDNEAAAVRWARDYIRLHANTAEQPLLLEQKLYVYRDVEVVMEGTLDVICGDEIFDLKWMRRDYKPQMAAYALALMQIRGTLQCTYHVLHGANMRAEKRTMTRIEAEIIVYSIIDAVKAAKVCRTSEYCSWCIKAPTCDVLVNKIKDVALVEQQDELSTYTAEQLGEVLNTASRAVVWAEKVRERVKELAIAGQEVDGYILAERKNVVTVPSEKLAEAFVATNLPSAKFLQACKLSLPSLATVYAEHTGLPVSDAKRAINNLLSDLIPEAGSYKLLVKRK